MQMNRSNMMRESTMPIPEVWPMTKPSGTLLERPAIKQVMLVEDHEDFHEALSLRLRVAGVRVISAYDGFGALCGIVEQKPDLVVLDLGLPDLHGLELMHFLRTIPGKRQTPVLVLTGETDPTVEKRALELGVRRVLFKPVRQRMIVNTVLEMVRGDG